MVTKRTCKDCRWSHKRDIVCGPGIRGTVPKGKACPYFVWRPWRPWYQRLWRWLTRR